MSHLQRRYRTTLYVGLVVTAVITTLACVDVHIKNGWCTVDSDCTSGHCDTTHNACFQTPADMAHQETPPDLTPPPPSPCTHDSDCKSTAAPICDLMTNLCRGCDDSDGGVSPECQQTSSGATNDHCASTGACVVCTQNSDCVNVDKTCLNNSCVACTSNSQCSTGVCDSTGQCGDPGKYIFVNKAGPSCTTGGTGAGTFTDPYCKIQTGFNAMATSTTGILGVVVYAGTYAENISIPTASASYTVRAIGVGQPVIMTTTGLSLTGTAFNVSLDGFTITGATGTSNAVSCVGNLTSIANTALTLTRSTVTGNKHYGIASTPCQLTIDQSIITANDFGGIVATDSTVTIRNSIVASNGVTTATAPIGGIKAQTSGGSSSLTIIDSTIYGNISKDVASAGVNCPVGSTSAVFDSVIFGNVISGSGAVLPEISDACNPDTCAFPLVSGGAPGTSTVNLSGCMAAQLFTNVAATDPSTGFVPKAGTTCTLVDKGAMTNAGKTLTASTVDLVGTTRPQGAGYDIGALELK